MSYKTLGMMKDGGMQKDINDLMSGGGGTPYMLARERAQYLVSVSQFGRMTQEGFLMNTAKGLGGHFIFVMDGEGQIYSASKSVVHHHSSFLAGGPVAAAGWWGVEYGALKYITNDSGHYQPPIDYTKQVLEELKKRGVDITGVEQRWTGFDSKRLAAAAEKRGVTFQRMGPKGVVTGRF